MVLARGGGRALGLSHAATSRVPVPAWARAAAEAGRPISGPCCARPSWGSPFALRRPPGFCCRSNPRLAPLLRHECPPALWIGAPMPSRRPRLWCNRTIPSEARALAGRRERAPARDNMDAKARLPERRAPNP